VRCWSSLGDSRRGYRNVNLARLLNNGIHGILNVRLVVSVSLQENSVRWELDEGGAVKGGSITMIPAEWYFWGMKVVGWWSCCRVVVVGWNLGFCEIRE
jgi:hypothetical protein